MRGSISVVKEVASRSPTLEAMLQEHIKDNDEILAHVFFGDITRHVVSLFVASMQSGSSLPNELKNILDYVEEAFCQGADDVQELISVSFLENLPSSGEEGAGIRDIIGPNLKKELETIENWRPE
jgi:hypothetical protein